MRSRPISPVSRRRRRARRSCLASGPGTACPPRASRATCISAIRRRRRCCSSCVSEAFRWAASRFSHTARPQWRVAGWSVERELGARSDHAGAWGARRDARLSRRRNRRRRTIDGRHQGRSRGRVGGESGGPVATSDGSGRYRDERVLAPASGTGCLAGCAGCQFRGQHSGGRRHRARRKHRSRTARAATRRGDGRLSPHTRAVENWTLQPLTEFVREASVRLVLVLTPSGQVLAQSGFSRAVDVMSAAALAAAIVASTGELARQMQQPPFAALSHQGPKHGFFLATFVSDRGTLAVLAVYDLDVSSLGLVQLFYEQLAADLKAASPKHTVPKQVLAADFERELTDSLNTLFGR